MMSRYRLKRNLRSIQGADFFKDEVVEGSLNPDGLHIDIVRDNKFKNNINTLINYSDVEKVSNDTPLTDAKKVKEYVIKSNKTIATSMSIGALGGLSLAFFKKQGFLEYVAFSLLGSIAGLLIGNEINKRRKVEIITIVDSKDNKENINEK